MLRHPAFIVLYHYGHFCDSALSLWFSVKSMTFSVMIWHISNNCLATFRSPFKTHCAERLKFGCSFTVMWSYYVTSRDILFGVIVFDISVALLRIARLV